MLPLTNRVQRSRDRSLFPRRSAKNKAQRSILLANLWFPCFRFLRFTVNNMFSYQGQQCFTQEEVSFFQYCSVSSRAHAISAMISAAHCLSARRLWTISKQLPVLSVSRMPSTSLEWLKLTDTLKFRKPPQFPVSANCSSSSEAAVLTSLKCSRCFPRLLLCLQCHGLCEVSTSSKFYSRAIKWFASCQQAFRANDFENWNVFVRVFS